MKGFYFLLSFLFFAISAYSQAPQGINYQAVIRNVSGSILANQNIAIRINVREAASNGNIAYSETHNAITNAYGLVNLVIGQGNAQTGNFATVSWGSNSYFAEIQVDISGGTNYQTIGNQQLMSVPYALYAEKSGVALSSPAGSQGPMGLTGATGAAGKDGCDIISVGDMVVVYTSTHAYGFSQSQSSWTSQPYPDDNPGSWTSIALNDTVVGVEASEKQIVIYTNTHAYGFSQDQLSGSTQPYPNDNIGQWTSIQLNGTPLGSLHSQKQVVVYTNTYAYGFSQSQSSWSNQPHPDDNPGQWTPIQLSGTPVQGKASRKNIVLYTNTHAYGFSQDQLSGSNQPYPNDDAGQWTTIQLGGTPKGIINTK